MSLSEVEYQGHAQRWIQRAVLSDRLAHAYLFHGPDGVGKERFARGFAQLVLCPESVDQELEADRATAVGLDRLRTGCGRCEDCRALAADSHPDLHLIYRQLNRDHPDAVVRKRKGLDIGVDVLRHFVIEKVGLKPSRGQAKVFIVREADRITPAAQNAMLKTLEEPPGTTYLILLVRALDRLLPTTLSRCQVVRFDVLPPEFVRRKLAELSPGVPAEQLDWYARSSGGSLGGASERIKDELYSLNQRLLAGLASLGGAGAKGGLPRDGAIGADLKSWTEAAKELGDRYRKQDKDITDTDASRRGLKTLFRLAADWYADILRVGSGDSSSPANNALRADIARAAESLPASRAIDLINRLARAEHQLDLNANTQLCVETLLNDLARLSRDQPVPVS